MGVYIEWMDGTAYAAANWDDLAKVVKVATPLQAPDTKEKWMDGVRYRVAEFYDHEIVYTDTESFFKELFRIGMLNDLREKSSPT